MELRHLRYFLAVAQESNVTRAAEKLGIGQPPLSQQIKSLEQELGVILFRRTAHGVVLTPAGEAFQHEAIRVLEGAHQARRAAQRAARGETGHLRLGFTASAAFNPVVSETIKRFRATFPHAELTLEEANTVKLLQSLEAGRLDAVFIRPGPATQAGMDLHRLANEATKIALPSDHPLASKKRLSMAELADEPFVLFPRAMGMSLYDEILHACQRAGFTPQLGQEAPQISSIVNLVAAGLGVSVVPASITQVRLTGVRYRDIAGQAPVARLAVATRTGNDTAVVSNLLRLLQAPRTA